MRCPFLREAQVKYCQASPFKKMILRAPEHDTPERCSSREYAHCPSAKHLHEGFSDPGHCPFLRESPVQYCSAASVTKFIPYSESILSRCGSESHRYCDLYLALASPPSAGSPLNAGGFPAGEGAAAGDETVDGIQVRTGLFYSTNHMWLDVNEDGYCHVGVDAFVTRVLGSIDRLAFIAAKGISRPTAILTVRGADLQMVFPNSMLLTRPNSYLRANPEKLLSDPYGVGWLFEGEPATRDYAGRADLLDELIPGKSAPGWTQEEVRRLVIFIHERFAHSDARGEALMPDGGGFAPGLVGHMNRDDILTLFNEFFSLYGRCRR